MLEITISLLRFNTYIMYLFSMTLWAFIDINDINIAWTNTIRAYGKLEILDFQIILNNHISFNISLTCSKFSAIMIQQHTGHISKG